MCIMLYLRFWTFFELSVSTATDIIIIWQYLQLQYALRVFLRHVLNLGECHNPAAMCDRHKIVVRYLKQVTL